MSRLPAECPAFEILGGGRNLGRWLTLMPCPSGVFALDTDEEDGCGYGYDIEHVRPLTLAAEQMLALVKP